MRKSIGFREFKALQVLHGMPAGHYASSIARTISAIDNAPTNAANVVVTMQRLHKKRYVKRFYLKPRKGERGARRICYLLTAAGRQILKQTAHELKRWI